MVFAFFFNTVVQIKNFGVGILGGQFNRSLLLTAFGRAGEEQGIVIPKGHPAHHE
jgi:hypothetical protein